MAVDDQYTKSLLHFDGGITDESGKTWTAYGGAATSATQSKFGTGALYLDGADDYLQSLSSTDLAFGTGDFTVDFWFRSDSTSNKGLFQFGGLSTAYSTLLTMNIENGTTLMYKNNSISFSVSAGTWYHLAVIRSSGTVKVYIDGVSRLSIADTTDYTANHVVIGGYYTTSYLFRGYIDELRISKGIARWTSNFTPPTAPYGPIILPQKKIYLPNALLSTSIAQR